MTVSAIASADHWLRSHDYMNVIVAGKPLAAVTLLREHFPELLIRVVNVVDLTRLQPASEHPHGLTDPEFDALFMTDRPVTTTPLDMVVRTDLDRFHLAMDVIRDWRWPLQEGTSP